MKIKVKFWNRLDKQQGEITVEIDMSSDGFLKKMAEMRREDTSFGPIDRTATKILEEISKGETISSIVTPIDLEV